MTRNEKTVLSATVLGSCDAATSIQGLLTDCNKDWGVRIFIGDSDDRVVNGKPVGIWENVGVTRVLTYSVSYGRVQ